MLRGVRAGRIAIGAAGKVLSAGPGRPMRDIVPIAGEFEEVAGIKPLGKGGIFTVKRRVFAVKEGVGAEGDGRAGAESILPGDLPFTYDGVKSTRHVSEQVLVPSNRQFLNQADGQPVVALLAPPLV